jgi:acetoin utilization protein AcuC
VPPAIAGYAPDVLVTQLGCDTHATDPLAHLALVTDDYMQIAARLHDLAHRHTGGRWVAVGGGGYQLASVVPRAWTIYFAELSGGELPHEVPWEWLGEAEEATGVRPPDVFTDPPVQLMPARVAAVREAAEAAVEQLKRDAFEELARHT